MEPKSHLFDVEIAIRHGVNAAIVIQYFAFWIQKNKANENKKRHFYQDRWWTFNSREAFSHIFPYWTPKQIRRILDNLVRDKIILKRQQSEGGDRSNWYAFCDDIPLDQKGQCHRPKRANGLPKRANGSAQTGQCSILGTDNYTDKLPDKQKSSSPKLSASGDGEQQAYQLLRKEGVGRSTAQILASQYTVDEIVQAITGAVMKAEDISTGNKSAPFKRAGYIVATLNQARSEGHPVKLSRKVKKRIETKGTGRIDTALSNQEMKQRKQILSAALFAVH